MTNPPTTRSHPGHRRRGSRTPTPGCCAAPAPRITAAGSPTSPPPAAASAPSGSPGSCTPSRRPPAASSPPATPSPTCPTGCIYVPCGDRRASVCPPCAETYRADTYQLIRAGLVGGKGVPDIRRRPSGRVRHPHRALLRARPHPQREPQHREGRARAGCAATSPPARTAGARLHRPPHRGRPLHWAGRSAWTATTTPPTSSGTPGPVNSGAAPSSPSTRALRPLERAHGVKLRVSYGKVAEYQRRGVVHFHALIRLDLRRPRRPGCRYSRHPPGSPPPTSGELVAAAVTATRFLTPDYADTRHSWPIEWGRQLDIRPVTPRRPLTARRTCRTEAVAAYLAKYATKATEPTGLPVTGRMNGETAEHYADPDTHLGRLIAYAWQLGSLPIRLDQPSEQRERLARHLRPAAPLDPHARLRRPLRHQVPPLLHHPQSPARRPPRMAAHHPRRLVEPPPPGSRRRLVVDDRRRHHADRLPTCTSPGSAGTPPPTPTSPPQQQPAPAPTAPSPAKNTRSRDQKPPRSGEEGTVEKYLTVAQTAEYLSTSERFVRRLIAERRVAFHHVGRHIRFRQSDLDVWLDSQRVEAFRPVNRRRHRSIS